MAKLEEIFSASMKQPRKLLDLSKVKICDDATFTKYIDRVPDLKLRPDIVDPSEIQILIDYSFTAPKQEKEKKDTVNSSSSSKLTETFQYLYEDPLPLSMRSTRLEDLWALDIHWKMLTSDRPPNRLEGDIFERLVELGRFSLAARKQEQVTIKAIMSSIIGTPATTYLIALGFITSRSKRGAIETRLKMCKNCGIEMCTGAFCKMYHYESYTRMLMDKDELENQEREEMAFLKEVSKSAGDAVGATPGAGPSTSTTAKKAQQQAPAKKSKQGKKLKMQIKKTRKRKKKKKIKENLEPVSAPEE